MENTKVHALKGTKQTPEQIAKRKESFHRTLAERGWSPELREKYRNNRLGKSMSEEAKGKISKSLSGKKYEKWSPEARSKISALRKGRPSPNKGKPMSDAQKEKLRQANLGKRLSDETKLKISVRSKEYQQRTGQFASLGRQPRNEKQRDTSRRNIIGYMHTARKRETKIERTVREILESLGIGFESQRVWDNIGISDFYIPSKGIAIECDGTYWHSKPNVIECDKEKDRQLRLLGIRTIRYREDFIEKDPQGLIENIKSL